MPSIGCRKNRLQRGFLSRRHFGIGFLVCKMEIISPLEDCGNGTGAQWEARGISALTKARENWLRPEVKFRY